MSASALRGIGLSTATSGLFVQMQLIAAARLAQLRVALMCVISPPTSLHFRWDGIDLNRHPSPPSYTDLAQKAYHAGIRLTRRKAEGEIGAFCGRLMPRIAAAPRGLGLNICEQPVWPQSSPEATVKWRR